MSIVPQLGLPEIMVLAVLALLVVGPKDLPKFLYGVGKIVGKFRRMADEFRSGLSQMAREAEIEEMRQEIEALRKGSGTEDVSETFRDIETETRKPVRKPTGNEGGRSDG